MINVEPKTQREKDIYLKGYSDAEAAYGKCHFCYGKGYSTTRFQHGVTMNFCSCERGKQLDTLWQKSSKQ